MKAANRKYTPASVLASVLAMLGASAALPSFATDDSEAVIPASIKKPAPIINFLETYKIEFEGILMLDMTNARGAYADEGSLSEASIRRARLGINSALAKNLTAQASLNVDEKITIDSWHKAAIDYKFSKVLSLDAGLMKQPFGLEESTSSTHLRTFERSMASNAFSPARGFGIALTHASSAHFASLGAFAGRKKDDVQDLTARVVWSPVNDKHQVLHVGASVNLGNYSGANYQVSNSGNIAVSKNFVKSAEYNPDTVQTINLEGAWSIGSLLLQSEWLAQSLTLPGGESGPVFSGGQVQAAWVFGGGHRKYKGQRFRKMTGTSGPSIELVAGAGVIDVSDADQGDEAFEVTFGINVQMNKNIGFGAQLQSVTVQDNNDGETSGTGVQLRVVATL